MRCRVCGNPAEGEEDICAECAERLSANPGELSRRKFLGWGIIAIGGLIGVGYLGSALKMLFPDVSHGGGLQSIGAVSEFPLNNYVLKSYTGNGYEDGVYVMNRGNNQFYALDFHCAHLQCPVQWFKSQNKFFCPCHGSVYSEFGEHIAGPAPRGLFRHQIKVSNGQVMLGPQDDSLPDLAAAGASIKRSSRSGGQTS